MSLSTWKKEFYPKNANKVSKKEALNHSLQKWNGLLKKNLKKHKVEIHIGALHDQNDLFYDAGLEIDYSSCALCFYYMENSCKLCPLAIIRGNIDCDALMFNEAVSPYRCFMEDKNILPMLKWLKKAKKYTGL